MMNRSNKGQSLVELAIVLPLITSLFLGTLSLLYFYFASLWLQHALYEGVLCLAAENSSTQCKFKTAQLIHRGLPIGTLEGLKLESRLQSRTPYYKAHLVWSLSRTWIYKKQFRINKRTIYP